MGLFDKIKAEAGKLGEERLSDAPSGHPKHNYIEYTAEDPAPEPQDLETETDMLEAAFAEDESEVIATPEEPEPTPEDDLDTDEFVALDEEPREEPDEATAPEDDDSQPITVTKKPAPKAAKPKETKRVTSSLVSTGPSQLVGKKSTAAKDVHPSGTASHATKAVATTGKPEEEAPKLENDITSKDREAIAALAAQLQLTGTEPVFNTLHMNFRIKVYINRIEYMGTFGKVVIPTGIIIETTTNKRVVMIVHPRDRIKLCDAILKVQQMYIDRSANGITSDGANRTELEKLGASLDELEKLARLKDKGIITPQEFAAKKRQLLGI
jgi:hypothetical protein